MHAGCDLRKSAIGDWIGVSTVVARAAKTIASSEASRGAAANDVNMLVCTGGCQRSEAEFRSLFALGGFTLSRIIPTGMAFASIIEGVPETGKADFSISSRPVEFMSHGFRGDGRKSCRRLKPAGVAFISGTR
jgi:hypothetical protein